MKNSILVIALGFIIFSCGNESTSENNSEPKKMESIFKEETTIGHLEPNTDNNTQPEDISSEIDKLITDEPVLEEKSLPTKDNVEIETKIIEETISTITNEIEIPATEETTNTPNHDEWNSILKSNVTSSGKVNYVSMKTKLSNIETYITNLESLSDQSTWSKNEKLAYWINLYNAATVRLIIQNYPTTSITSLNGGKPWDKKVVTISGKSYTLNQIENDIIRPRFKEPRIHFAVNCAAVSCPKIMNSAFTADKLNYQLTKQAKAFINGSKNSINENSVEISKIFEWYAVDFGSSIIEYLNKYSTTQINSEATIGYKEYNWNLNN